MVLVVLLVAGLIVVLVTVLVFLKWLLSRRREPRVPDAPAKRLGAPRRGCGSRVSASIDEPRPERVEERCSFDDRPARRARSCCATLRHRGAGARKRRALDDGDLAVGP